MPTWDKTADLEENNLSDFDATSGATIAASAASKKNGSYGLAVTIASTTVQYGAFTGPNNDTSMTVEFWYNPNGLAMADGDVFRIVEAREDTAGNQFACTYSRVGSDYFIKSTYVDDGATLTTHGSYLVPSTSAWYLVRLVWKAASGAGNNDGRYAFYINGVLVQYASNLDTDTCNIDLIRFGAVQGIDAGTSGTLWMDDLRYANECEWLSQPAGAISSAAGGLVRKTKKPVSGGMTA